MYEKFITVFVFDKLLLQIHELVDKELLIELFSIFTLMIS